MQVFRSVRLWHAIPAVCSSCDFALGKSTQELRPWKCLHPSCQHRSFEHMQQLRNHCQSSPEHLPSVARCDACGRDCLCPSTISSAHSSR